MPTTLRDHLAAVLRRRVTGEEIAVALDASLSTVKRRLTDGFPADDVIAVCRAFDVQPVPALVSCGLLTEDEVREATIGELASDRELLEELLERQRQREYADWDADRGGYSLQGRFIPADLSRLLPTEHVYGLSQVADKRDGSTPVDTENVLHVRDDAPDDYVLAAMDRDDSEEIEAQQYDP